MAKSPKSPAIDGDLYKMLAAKMPSFAKDGALVVADLADALGMSHEGVYRWLRNDDISKRGRTALVTLARSENVSPVLTEDDLQPFL